MAHYSCSLLCYCWPLTNTRNGWELKFITIAQIMDEGMVKPEDHQDVATQM